MKELETLIKNTTIETWGIDPETYNADAHFFDLGADSLDVIELFMAVEEQLGISDISDEAGISTPSELVVYLKQRGVEVKPEAPELPTMPSGKVSDIAA
jgi:acyl carrier protein